LRYLRGGLSSFLEPTVHVHTLMCSVYFSSSIYSTEIFPYLFRVGLISGEVKICHTLVEISMKL
jgi:hypothetical protein